MGVDNNGLAFVLRSHDRGRTINDVFKSWHSFSFADYKDEKLSGFSALSVLNDDIINTDSGFDTHGHKNVEIVTIVIDGELLHADSLGHLEHVPTGSVQLISAGTGIEHSEYNASSSKAVRIIQMWFKPNVLDTAPAYHRLKVSLQGKVTPIIVPSTKLARFVPWMNA